MRKFLISLWHDLNADNPTEQQLKNRLKLQQLKQKGINFFNENPLIIPFCLGLMILSMTVVLAIAIN